MEKVIVVAMLQSLMEIEKTDWYGETDWRETTETIKNIINNAIIWLEKQ